MVSREELAYVHRNDNTLYQDIGYVYFILAVEFNRIKIGLTTGAIMKRLGALQTGSCTPLTVLGYSTVQKPITLESNLHTLFKEQQVRYNGQEVGEWFYGHPLLYSFIWHFADKISNPSMFDIKVIEAQKDGLVFNGMMELKQHILISSETENYHAKPIKRDSYDKFERYING